MIKATKYIIILLISGLFFIPSIVNAETLVGTSVESRVALAFKVNDQAAQALLPDGWKLLTLPKGPFAGANMLTVFIDKHLYSDAEGKPLKPHASRTVGIVNYGIKKGVKGARLFLTLAYETPPVINPYSNSFSASITRNASMDGSENNGKNYTESWSVKPASGGELTLELSYQSIKPGWKSSKAMPFSNKKPDFYRIYTYEQLGELVMSKAMGKNLNGKISFKSNIPELSRMLDGTQSIVGILAIPIYKREISLP
ncbi:MAG: hypothetical protein GY744_06885 [Gammaproteobacteria bacterium]|nr:hypothetical protein [Gammaproteobacteria bacterium]